MKTFQGVFEDVPSACNAVSAIIGRGIVPAAMEMVDALTIKAVQSVMDAGYPDSAGAVLLIEVEGTDDEVDELEAEVRPVLHDARSTDVRAATDAADRERLWSGRKGALGALGSSGAELLPSGWGCAADSTCAGAGEGGGGVEGVPFPHCQRVPRRGWEPAPVHPVRRATGG